jgi:hypothetical protein
LRVGSASFLRKYEYIIYSSDIQNYVSFSNAHKGSNMVRATLSCKSDTRVKILTQTCIVD